MTETYKKCKGWKVILKGSRKSISAFSFDPDQTNTIAVKYPVGVYTYPKKGEAKAKLFFFRNKVCAEKFAYQLPFKHLVKIVPCIAMGVTKPLDSFRIASLFRDVSTFWSAISFYENITTPPEGTYLAESIKCLK